MDLAKEPHFSVCTFVYLFAYPLAWHIPHLANYYDI
jgi:hypothetical protein